MNWVAIHHHRRYCKAVQIIKIHILRNLWWVELGVKRRYLREKNETNENEVKKNFVTKAFKRQKKENEINSSSQSYLPAHTHSPEIFFLLNF